MLLNPVKCRTCRHSRNPQWYWYVRRHVLARAAIHALIVLEGFSDFPMDAGVIYRDSGIRENSGAKQVGVLAPSYMSPTVRPFLE
jgi:hypothetical protein